MIKITIVLMTFRGFGFAEVVSEKPNYEVGSAAKLSFGKNSATKQAIAAVWKLDQDDDDQEEINADDLLDEEDKIKPDPSTLKGTTNINQILVRRHNCPIERMK